MSSSPLGGLLGADPARPWPGVARDVDAAEAGIAALSRGRSLLRLGPSIESWPGSGGSFDVVVAPLAVFTSSPDPDDHVLALRKLVQPGGLLVTEELAPPVDLAFVEPTVVNTATVVLSAVTATSGVYRLSSVRLSTGSSSISTYQLRPRSPHDVDEVLGADFALVGRWSDWVGGTVRGARWHVAVHTATSTS